MQKYQYFANLLGGHYLFEMLQTTLTVKNSEIYFPVNYAKTLRTVFLQNNSGSTAFVTFYSNMVSSMVLNRALNIVLNLVQNSVSYVGRAKRPLV